MPKLRVRHAFTAVLLLVAMLFQGTWALAGTTGGLTGYVRDTDGAPVANAKVTVSSPSEMTSTTTDGSGHFAFLSLAPDTYVLSASKVGYQDTSMAGVTVFADNVQSVSVNMPKALKTIAAVHSQAASSLVKSGVGGDIYNVDPSQMQKTAALGGGGNMDSAYSAIASVPGLVVGTGGNGWNQAVVVRGANPWETGFEYDSIPVNRAFDNYTASTASNLGLQELQVYTGGGPSSISSTGASGFINQVIKTGTYPGFGTLSGGLSGIGAFYHSARVEAGGASPNRNFSYYVGLSGYDQAFRIVDNQNGGSYFGLGSPYGTYGYVTNMTYTGQGVLNACDPNLGLADPNLPVQGCLPEIWGNFGYGYLNSDRENVVNLHLGMPRKDGQKDDVQLMWSSSALKEYWDTTPSDQAGPGGLNGYMVAMTGLPYCPPSGVGFGCAAAGGPNYPTYTDPYTYNLPFGTPIAPGGKTVMPQIYYQPNSPGNRAPNSALPLNSQDLTNNDTGIVKLQLTHPFNSRSFARLMGYTFFSDWTENGNNSAYTYLSGFAAVSPNYDLITHTSGGMLQYFNQLSDKHLLQFTGNYTHSAVSRFNNTGFLGGATTPIGLISMDANGNYVCYDSRNTLPNPSYDPSQPTSSTNEPTITNPGAGQPIPCYSSHYKSSAGYVAANGAPPPVPAAAAAAGAQWETLYEGNARGTFNNVVPNFYSASLEDQWRPSDKLTINASVRYDQFNYNLAKANGADPFYAQIVAKYSCFNPTTGSVLQSPLLPGQFAPAPAKYTATCPTGYYHPDGSAASQGVPAFTLNVPNTYSMKYFEPRLSGTFTQNPDTVWRFSAGRFAEPPLSAAVEYLYRGGRADSLWANFENLGAFSPFHAIAGETSAQYDISLEHRIHGTPVSFKITPFYGTTSNWEEQSFIGAGFVTQIPVGKARNYGVESQLSYGDFNKEGLSGLISFTYTKSEVQFQPLLGSSQIQQANIAIDNFNAMTKAGGGAPCYDPTTADANGFNAPDPACKATSIANPYYNMSPQGHLDVNGWYPQGETALAGGGLNDNSASWYNSPYVTNLVLNYRHEKLAITPSLQIQAGAQYGSPYDVKGMDPRVCGQNQGAPIQVGTDPKTGKPIYSGTGVADGNNPLTCDYTTAFGPGAAPVYGYLYVPNPQTGKFASPGEFNQPNIAMLNLQLSYDVSPKVTLQLTAGDLWHSCFGGTKEAWTAANAPSKVNCGYYSNSLFVNNFYNGQSPSDKAANGGVAAYPWMNQTYSPKFNNSIGGYIPFTLYLQAQIKL